jgi:flagellar basal-body rod protein FlgC
MFGKRLIITLFMFGAIGHTAPIHGQVNLEEILHISASGVMAQKMRMSLIAMNVANMSTQLDENTGEPYQKRYSVITPLRNGVRTDRIVASKAPYEVYYEPTDPRASKTGFIKLPNVDLPGEMVDLNMTEMILDANTTVFKSTKTVITETLSILK